jgi:hypothetical protein
METQTSYMLHMLSIPVYSDSTPLRPRASKRACLSYPALSFSYTRRISKPEGLNPAAVTPFDCCSLSFQPFSHPVCARNTDGTGTVFDLTNIIPWLK